MNQDRPFPWPDAWILLAVLMNDRPQGGSLRDLIATADYINRAVPSYAEISTSLTRLVAGGLAEESKGRFRPTAAAAARYAPIEKAQRSVLKRLKAVEDLLGSDALGHAETASQAVVVSPQDYDQAMREYQPGT